MHVTPQYIDIHCHVLPGVDDGPTSVEEAVELVDALGKVGFTELYPTPHQMARRFEPTDEELAEAYRELCAGLEAEQIAMRVAQPAGENMWDDLFLERQAPRMYPCYPSGAAFLVEFGPVLPPGLADRLFAYRLEGLLPVIAHIERFPELCVDPLLEQVGSKAALLVNLSAVAGALGWTIKRRARQLVRSGRVHALTTDAHTVLDAQAAAKAIEWLERTFGSASVLRWLRTNPQSILRGELPEP